MSLPVSRIEQIALHSFFGRDVGKNHSGPFVGVARAKDRAQDVRGGFRQFKGTVRGDREFHYAALVILR